MSSLKSFSRPSLLQTLRLTTIFTFPPAFLFLLLHGIIDNALAPALGSIPAFFSALLGLHQYLAAKEKRSDYEPIPSDGEAADDCSPYRSSTVLAMTADLALASSLLITLVFSWITLGNGGSAVLGTYATVGLIIDWLIHSYFTILHFCHLISLMSELPQNGTICSHCYTVVHHRCDDSTPTFSSIYSLSTTSLPSYSEVAPKSVGSTQSDEERGEGGIELSSNDL